MNMEVIIGDERNATPFVPTKRQIFITEAKKLLMLRFSKQNVGSVSFANLLFVQFPSLFLRLCFQHYVPNFTDKTLKVICEIFSFLNLKTQHSELFAVCSINLVLTLLLSCLTLFGNVILNSHLVIVNSC